MPADSGILGVLMVGLMLGLTLFSLATSGYDLLRSRHLHQRAREASGLARAASAAAGAEQAVERYDAASAAGAGARASAAMENAREGEARAMFDAVRSARQPASWRIYRFMDRRDFNAIQALLIVGVIGLAQAISCSGALRSGVPPIVLVVGAFILIVLGGMAIAGGAQLRHSRLGRAFARRAPLIILTPRGMSAGKPSTGALTFHLRYRDVAHLTTERIGLSGEGAQEHHWLHVTFVDGSRTAWECSAPEAKQICRQIIRDWRAHAA